MSKITISVDNTADLGDELIKKHGIERICMGVVIGDKVGTCGDITPEEVYQAVEVDGITPKTSAALEVDYRELFERSTKDGGSIIHITLSAKCSVAPANAKRAAKGLDRVYIVDSKNLSIGTGLLALKAAELRDLGKSAEEVFNTVLELVEKVDISFVAKDLKYLHRGGRVSGLKLLGANMLKIRPSFVMSDDGRLIPGKKFKGNWAQAIKDYTKHRFQEHWGNIDKSLAFVMSTEIDDEIRKEVINDVKSFGFKEVIVLPIGTTMTIHLGRNGIGIAAMKK